jgi:hypothetical protein
MSATEDQYLLAALERVTAIQMLAVPEAKAAGDYPFFTYATTPYWINYLSTVTPSTAPHEMNQRTEYTLKMRLVTGHKTEGYDGTLARKLYVWIPEVIEYFQARRYLQYESGQAPVRYLDPRGVRITLSRFGVFPLGSDTVHIGAEFDLVLPFNRQITPVYQ